VTPEHFGLTTGRKWLLAALTLACFVLPMILFPPWSPPEIITGLLTWLAIGFWLYIQNDYSLEVGDNSVRVGRTVARKKATFATCEKSTARHY
jgi:uncharacterized membrane protein YoaK (UPF0700 family)